MTASTGTAAEGALEARREPGRDGGAGVAAGRGRPHRVGQRGGGATGGAGDCGGSQVGPERVGGPAHHEGPAHAVQRLAESAGTEVGRRPVATGTLGPPQELGHLLEARARRQIGGQAAAVDGAELLVELGHARGDGGEPGGRLAAAPTAGRQSLDLCQVEEAPAPPRVPVRLEEAAAHVGVQRGHLDAETAGRLLGGQHPVHLRQLTLT